MTSVQPGMTPLEHPDSLTEDVLKSGRSVTLTVRRSWTLIRRGGVALFASMLAVSLLISIIAFPLIGWLFREAARSAGMVVIDLHTLHLGANSALTAAILLILVIVAFWAAALQLLVTVVALHRASEGKAAAGKGLLRDLLRVLHKLLKFSAWPLALYLLVMLPLSGLGFTTLVAQGVAIPPFITGELLKTPATAMAIHAASVGLLYLNIRFALAIPIFALTYETGTQAMRSSWELTRGKRIVPVVVGALVYLVLGTLLAGALLVVSLVPTAIADWVAPSVSATVAAYSLGAAHMVMLLITSLVMAGINAVAMERVQTLLPVTVEERVPVAASAVTPATETKRSKVFLLLLMFAGTILLGASWTPVMQQLDSHPDTLILGHRGFSGGGVENTIGGLEAAHAAGADLVEMDVMETKDGQFVVMHDPELSRLAGQKLEVKDLTLAELQQITVQDSHGHTDNIPSVEDYVLRAAELGQLLLIEIKLGGADTPDHVDRLLAQLEELGVADKNIYHTLDYDSAERLKGVRPDLTVGYILPIAGIGIPDTSADFVVVEEQSASRNLLIEAQDAGLSFFVWTVNDPEKQRLWLHEGADGIITDHPDIAINSRTSIQDDTGMVRTLADMLSSFVLVF